MGASVVFEGLDELRAQLRSLPADLAAEASGIVIGKATEAFQEIHDAYPDDTGTLRDRLTLLTNPSAFGAGAILKNTDPIAWIFENGSQVRRSREGNPSPMPPGHVFIPIAQRKRLEMYEQLQAMVVAHGVMVSGDAE
jgi:hypothetical protein